MPNLTPEQVRARDVQVAQLKADHRDACAFPYSQSALLKWTPGYTRSQGVCYGMCVDWLMRRLWGLYRPLKDKPKPNLNDPKFQGLKRVKLTRKHGELQAIYASAPNSDSLLPDMAKRSLQTKDASLMARRTEMISALRSKLLESYTGPEAAVADIAAGALSALDREWTESAVDVDVPANARQAIVRTCADARSKLGVSDQGVGLMINMQGAGAGHEIVVLFTASQSYVFDPNIGEYFFDTAAQADRLVNFIALLWWRVYARFYHFEEVTFTRVRCGTPEIAPTTIEL